MISNTQISAHVTCATPLLARTLEALLQQHGVAVQPGGACAVREEEGGLRVGEAWLPFPLRAEALMHAVQQAPAVVLAMPGGWQLDSGTRTLTHGTQPALLLTEKETALLVHLAAAQGSSMPREALLERVWGYGDDISTRTLETHIHRLRSKLKDAGVEWIETTESGYRLGGG